MSRPYRIDRERAIQLSSVVLLDEMTELPRSYPLLLDAAEASLEPVLEFMHSRGYVKIVDDERYELTEKGSKTLERFMSRYDDFVKTMDVYSAVDLEEGVFAFERFFDFESDADFSDYLRDERWEDLRVAVAELKKIDPVEIVFMSFLQEERLTAEGSSPGNGLLEGRHWLDIEEICNSALSVDDLAFDDEGVSVSGAEVLKRIIVEGVELNIELKKHESELADHDPEPPAEGGGGDEQQHEVVTETTSVEYYTPYLDPLYVSPVWLGLWLL